MPHHGLAGYWRAMVGDAHAGAGHKNDPLLFSTSRAGTGASGGRRYVRAAPLFGAEVNLRLNRARRHRQLSAQPRRPQGQNTLKPVGAP